LRQLKHKPNNHPKKSDNCITQAENGQFLHNKFLLIFCKSALLVIRATISGNITATVRFEVISHYA